MNKKQVPKEHYNYKRYLHKRRWISIWHQLDEVITLNPSSVLELGPGPGIFKLLANHLGLNVKTVDIDPDLEPDYVASATDLPFDDNSFDCVCAFQMLEHLPYEKSLIAFKEMARVAKKNVVISLPDAKKLYRYSFYIPFVGQRDIFIPKPQIRPKIHKFGGEHYWEINKKGYPLKRITDDFLEAKMYLKKTFRVAERTFHRFFVYSK